VLELLQAIQFTLPLVHLRVQGICAVALLGDSLGAKEKEEEKKKRIKIKKMVGRACEEKKKDRQKKEEGRRSSQVCEATIQ